MVKTISLSKRKKIQQSLDDAIQQVNASRSIAIHQCRVDPYGTDPFAGRAFAIRNYCGARRWVRHYRDILATSQPTKMSNQYARAVDQ